jgi:hypothetical protein
MRRARAESMMPAMASRTIRKRIELHCKRTERDCGSAAGRRVR